MLTMSQLRKVIRRVVFGDTLLPQAFTIGLQDPQTEITVWLHGMNAPLDVTYSHSMACADPFTVCLAFDEEQRDCARKASRLSLRFCERSGQRRVLGEIKLKLQSAAVVPAAEKQFVLFEAQSSSNYCLPKGHVLAHYLRHRYLLWRKVDIAGAKMSFLDRRAVMVMFIRPHPVVLVSLCGEGGGNIFPMNIMGDLGDGYFALALKESRLAAHLVEQAGRVALSNVPIAQTSAAYKLGVNHHKQSIDWDQLPFALKMSSALQIPVPAFAERVRELEVEAVRRLGSHIFFVTRVVRDERFEGGDGLCIVHGFYQAWRLRGRRAELEASLVEDARNKRGMPQEPSLL